MFRSQFQGVRDEIWYFFNGTNQLSLGTTRLGSMCLCSLVICTLEGRSSFIGLHLNIDFEALLPLRKLEAVFHTDMFRIGPSHYTLSEFTVVAMIEDQYVVQENNTMSIFTSYS